MTKLFSRSVIKPFLLAITLICATAQVRAALEGPTPIVSVDVSTLLGFSTFRATRTLPLNPYTFSATWEIPTGMPSGSADLYFGLFSPDAKTVYSWVRQDGGIFLLKGMHPFMEGVNLNTPATYHSGQVAGRSMRYSITGNEQPGMYLVFALVVGTGKNAADVSNWTQIEMRPLVIQ